MIHIENCEQIFKQLLWKYKQTYDPYNKTREYLLIVHIVVHWYKHDLQGWTLNFESTRYSDEQPSKCTRLDKFSLAQIFPPPLPPKSFPYCDHALAMAGQLAISLTTALSCSSRTPMNHRQLQGFFSFFSPSTTFGTQEIYFHILARNDLTFSNLPEGHALIKNNSLATLLSTQQTRVIASMKNYTLRP